MLNLMSLSKMLYLLTTVWFQCLTLFVPKGQILCLKLCRAIWKVLWKASMRKKKKEISSGDIFSVFHNPLHSFAFV